MAETQGAGEPGVQQVMPIGQAVKAKARKRIGKARYRRKLPVMTGQRQRRGPYPCLRPDFNPEDFRMAREIVERYCPARVPRSLRRYMKGPFDLFDALIVYVLAVEFGWNKEAMARDLGRSRKVQDVWIAQIEDARETCDFIEQICQKAQDYCRGLL
ncbi:hypothetical protein [Asticcacaulis taihuensis]|uniref:hypothetical protein n=1 Tax=Asticcacaulis taihuensis TaxID=260084 RepID=UPI0026E9CAFD|nr:hypothetical protein [Asticcacaulis taihuensis]